MNNVQCDSCKSKIKITIKTERAGKIDNEVIKFNYFQCKKCKRKYFVGVESKRVRQIQRELKANGVKAKGLDDIDEILKANESLRAELKEIFNKAKETFKEWK